MTVKELIDKLSTFDETLTVTIADDDDEDLIEIVDVTLWQDPNFVDEKYVVIKPTPF